VKNTHTALLALLLTISGCSFFGLATPKGFDQSLAQAYSVHTAVVSATATAVASGAISSAEATQVQTQAISSRQILDLAKTAETAGNTAGAQQNLALALTGLNALQTYLNSRGAK
jgi:hypothetical protein